MKNVKRLTATSLLVLGVAAPALAQAPQPPQGGVQTATPVPAADFPTLQMGVVTFLQYAAELQETDHYNAFDVTRGYFNLQANLSKRVRARFTPDVRPMTDARLVQNLALRLEYAYLEADLTDRTSVIFGAHETPWLTFEERVNRYRVQGAMFSERQGLIPGPSDVGASIRTRGESTEYHFGVYNGEGNGRAEADKYKSLQGRATFRAYHDAPTETSVRLSGFYSYGWYAQDRPRNVAIVMGSYESPNVVATAQYLTATDNPFVARDIERKGMSIFGEGRQGPTGWAGIGRVDFFDPDESNGSDQRRRYTFGGAHWSQIGRSRLGIVISMEQLHRATDSMLLERRALVQTHVEF
jgi:hypothetical protein